MQSDRKCKNKYRKNPIYAKNLTLGWCDLRQGEDLCQEINLWTYWQGKDYAKNTPHIKYMLIGQDFGPPEKEEVKGTIANVRKMNDGIDVMFHEHVNLEARDSQTDKNIVRYFELLGKEKLMSINIRICFSAIVIWAIAEISILEI